MRRCYKEGLPDDIGDRLMKSGRIPSYRAIAIAILSNDHALRSLGFSGKTSKYYQLAKNGRLKIK